MVKESTKGSGENWLIEGKREVWWGGGYLKSIEIEKCCTKLKEV